MFCILCGLFVVLSALDLIFTLSLIDVCQMNIEGNPIASFFYETFGWIGMTFFKINMIAIAGTIAIYIHHKKRQVYAFTVIGFGCISTLVPVCYSLCLLTGTV
jgi:hypothetical protein